MPFKFKVSCEADLQGVTEHISLKDTEQACVGRPVAEVGKVGEGTVKDRPEHTPGLVARLRSRPKASMRKNTGVLE